MIGCFSSRGHFISLVLFFSEQVVQVKRLREASTRNQEEMKALKINLQNNVLLLNNVLGGLQTERITPRDDTPSAHLSAIGEQVGTLQELGIMAPSKCNPLHRMG